MPQVILDLKTAENILDTLYWHIDSGKSVGDDTTEDQKDYNQLKQAIDIAKEEK